MFFKKLYIREIYKYILIIVNGRNKVIISYLYICNFMIKFSIFKSIYEWYEYENLYY